jgi:hypothetical protein
VAVCAITCTWPGWTVVVGAVEVLAELEVVALGFELEHPATTSASAPRLAISLAFTALPLRLV